MHDKRRRGGGEVVRVGCGVAYKQTLLQMLASVTLARVL